MAASWALTGDLSGWSTSAGKKGLKQGGVVYHDPSVKRATVTLSGKLNGQPFKICRSAGSRGAMQHRFHHSGQKLFMFAMYMLITSSFSSIAQL
jgi:hypothetical protein